MIKWSQNFNFLSLWLWKVIQFCILHFFVQSNLTSVQTPNVPWRDNCPLGVKTGSIKSCELNWLTSRRISMLSKWLSSKINCILDILYRVKLFFWLGINWVLCNKFQIPKCQDIVFDRIVLHITEYYLF